MIDMSKVFDCFNRNKLIEDLWNNTEEDDLHIISILLNVSISVRCGNVLSEFFKTDIEAPQGDCASTLEFTYCLAKTLDLVKSNQPSDHSYVEQTKRSNIADHFTEHNCCLVT